LEGEKCQLKPALLKEKKMSFSPILALHISGGTLGLLSGAAAVFLRKGSRRHAVAGDVFVVSMLCLSASGVYKAIMKSQLSNILGGTLTFYMVATAGMTGRRREMKTNLFDWGAFLFASAVGVLTVLYGLRAAMTPSGFKLGYPAAPALIMGCIALLAATGDLRMLVRGGISGAQRLARHLWRMCFALFVASASIFLARAHLFPALLQRTGVLLLLSFLPLLLMIFWLIRVRFAGKYRPARGFARDIPAEYGKSEVRSQKKNNENKILVATHMTG
jgi:hypothetical protein